MKSPFSFIGLLCMFMSFSVFAQNNGDRFSDTEEMLAQRVAFYNAQAALSTAGPFIYLDDSGKLKLVKESSFYSGLEGNTYSVNGTQEVKKKKYLVLETGGKQYYLLFSDKINYTDYIRSVSYWERWLSEYSGKYSYLIVPSELVGDYKREDVLLNKYLPLKWVGIQMPKDINEDISVLCIVDGKEYKWSPQLVKDNEASFVGDEGFMREKEAQRVQAQKDSIKDITHVCEAKILHTASIKSQFINLGIIYPDTETLYLSVYGYADSNLGKTPLRRYKGIVLGKLIELSSESLVFTDPEAKAYIDYRGETGEKVRREAAFNNDDRQYARYRFSQENIRRSNEEAEKQYAEYRKAVAEYRKKNEVFILAADYSFSRFMFGLRFMFYNCFSKDIKYIDLDIVPYNRVGDIQPDDLGRKLKSVRSIGPFETGVKTTCVFDELFWDKHGVISRLAITKATITFMDGTTKVYNGERQINQHRSNAKQGEPYTELEEYLEVVNAGKK